MLFVKRLHINFNHTLELKIERFVGLSAGLHAVPDIKTLVAATEAKQTLHRLISTYYYIYLSVD